MLGSVFWNANTYLSEIFYFNVSESQTYSKYFHCQANMSNLSPWYIPPNVQAYDIYLLNVQAYVSDYT